MEHGGLVSVVVPTKDRPEMLRRAVSSVLEQTYAPIELIVIDDGSAEPAQEAIADLPTANLDRFVFRRHDENKGGAAARNTGIQESRGEYVAFLDDDDEWDPDKLERQITTLEEAGEDVAVAFTGNRQLDADGNTKHIHIRRTDGDISEDILYGNYIGSFSSVIFDRDLIKKVGVLDERFLAWQDWEYYVRLAQHAQFVSIPKPLVRRHVDHDGRISPGYDAKYEIAPVMFEDYLREPALRHGVERRVRGYLQARLGRAAWLEDRLRLARSHYASAVRIYPYDHSFWIFLTALSGGPFTMRVARVIKRTGNRLDRIVRRALSG